MLHKLTIMLHLWYLFISHTHIDLISGTTTIAFLDLNIDCPLVFLTPALRLVFGNIDESPTLPMTLLLPWAHQDGNLVIWSNKASYIFWGCGIFEILPVSNHK